MNVSRAHLFRLRVGWRAPTRDFHRPMLRRQSSPGVAPSPQAKGKIERRFGTSQNRLVALLAYEKITAYAPAQELLGRELARQNRTVCRTTARSPDEACAQAQAQGRTVGGGCPDPSLLDLHLRCTCAAASTPITKSTSAGAVGPSVPPPGRS